MKKNITFIAQLASIGLIWIFVISLTIWIINLITISIELNDVPGASIGISIITIPVFITLASVLTYVFVGLYKEEKKLLSRVIRFLVWVNGGKQPFVVHPENCRGCGTCIVICPKEAITLLKCEKEYDITTFNS